MAPLPTNSVAPATRAAWRAWLSQHYSSSQGVWLVKYKRSTGREPFTYDAAVTEALCFGWIDSRVKGVDAERAMQWYCPRRDKSVWSGPNKIRIAHAIKEGIMQEAGLAKIAQAKEDGSYYTLDAAYRLEVPQELHAAFDEVAGSKGRWDKFPMSVRRHHLALIAMAKRPETKAKRAGEIAREAAEDRRAGLPQVKNKRAKKA